MPKQNDEQKKKVINVLTYRDTKNISTDPMICFIFWRLFFAYNFVWVFIYKL